MDVWIHILSGSFDTNADWFADQDPSVTFQLNSHKYKTTVKNDAGKNATWNEKFKLEDVDIDS